jgi:hypothetical protein
MKDEQGFRIKQIRCEWHIVKVFVDPNFEKETGECTLDRFPDYESAKASLSKFGKPHVYLIDVWVPLNSHYEYERIKISYKEIVLT